MIELPNVELVAAKVHQAWITMKKLSGVTSSISQATGEEQMRPYEELSEQIKEYDRATVNAVYAAIRELK